MASFKFWASVAALATGPTTTITLLVVGLPGTLGDAMIWLREWLPSAWGFIAANAGLLTPAWVMTVIGAFFLGILHWPDMRRRRAQASLTSTLPPVSPTIQDRNQAEPQIQPTQRSGEIANERDLEAKDEIVHFCRAHLYDLIEQERRCINAILREFFGEDPEHTVVGRYATKSIRNEFSGEPRIIAATKDSSYRQSLTKIQLEALLAEANAFTIRRSIFISQAIREKGFDRKKAFDLAGTLYKLREPAKAAWKQLASSPMYDTFQNETWRKDNVWGDLWMPAKPEESARE